MSYDPRKGESPYLGMDDGQDDVGVARDAMSAAPTRRASSPTASPSAPATTRLDAPARTDAARSQAVPRQMAPATVRRPAARRADMPASGTAVLRRQESAPQMPVAAPNGRRRVVAAPPQAPRARRGGIRAGLAAVGLRLLSLAARLAAIALSGIVVAASLGVGWHRAFIVSLMNGVTALVPAGIAGRLVRETPLGGAFRGDIACLVVALFVIDYLCLSYAAALSSRPVRGA